MAPSYTYISRRFGPRPPRPAPMFLYICRHFVPYVPRLSTRVQIRSVMAHPPPPSPPCPLPSRRRRKNHGHHTGHTQGEALVNGHPPREPASVCGTPPHPPTPRCGAQTGGLPASCRRKVPSKTSRPADSQQPPIHAKRTPLPCQSAHASGDPMYFISVRYFGRACVSAGAPAVSAGDRLRRQATACAIDWVNRSIRMHL